MEFQLARLLWVPMLLCCLRYCSGQIPSAADCTGSYAGIAMYGLCFFVGNAEATWFEAWDICAQKNAVLAQVHSSVEYNTIKTKLYGPGGKVWIALRRLDDSVYANNSCANGPTLWHDDANTSNALLPVQSTWMRTHCNDDLKHYPGPQLFFTVGSSGKLYDQTVNASGAYPLCQIPIETRTYTKSTACITGAAGIQSIQVVDAQACAYQCSCNSIWCRSFDYKSSCTGSNGCSSCKLFSWLASEPCPKCLTTSAVTGCEHYDADI